MVLVSFGFGPYFGWLAARQAASFVGRIFPWSQAPGLVAVEEAL